MEIEKMQRPYFVDTSRCSCTAGTRLSEVSTSALSMFKNVALMAFSHHQGSRSERIRLDSIVQRALPSRSSSTACPQKLRPLKAQRRRQNVCTMFKKDPSPEPSKLEHSRTPDSEPGLLSESILPPLSVARRFPVQSPC